MGAGVKDFSNNYFWRSKGMLAAFGKQSGTPITSVQSAVPGTNSTYGAFRVGTQLLSKDIDLLIIEFAVNDFESPGALDGMEGIVRQALRQNPRMGIVLFETVSKKAMQDYYEKGLLPPSVEAYRKIVSHYHLAEVNAGPMVLELFKGGRSSSEEFYPDGTHPSESGHAFYANLLCDALIKAISDSRKPVPESPAALPEPLGNKNLDYAGLSEIEPSEKSAGWEELPPNRYSFFGSWKTSTPDATMSFPVRGEWIGLLCRNISKLHVSGPGFEKTINCKAGPGNVPRIVPLYDGPDRIQGNITVEVLPDDQGPTEAELCGVASIQPPG